MDTDANVNQKRHEDDVGLENISMNNFDLRYSVDFLMQNSSELTNASDISKQLNAENDANITDVTMAKRQEKALDSSYLGICDDDFLANVSFDRLIGSHDSQSNANGKTKIDSLRKKGIFKSIKVRPDVRDETCDILNIKSIFTEDLVVDTVEIPADDKLTSEGVEDRTDELIRIVEQNQLQLYTTDDKDTFVISLDGEMSPEHLKKLFNDGVLSIHVDVEEKDNSFNPQTSNPESHQNKTNTNCSVNNIPTILNDFVDDNILVAVDRLATSAVNVGSSKRTRVANDVDTSIQSNKKTIDSHNAAFDTVWQQLSLVPSNKLNEMQVDGNANIIGRKVFSCKECGRNFHSKENYISHRGTHNARLRKHSCTVCKEKFSWRSSLVRHIESKHLGGERCTDCGKTVATKGQMKRHIKRVHLKERRLCCAFPNCNKVFYDNYGLNLHIRSHTGERPYMCGVCGARFSQSSYKTRHELMHETHGWRKGVPNCRDIM